MAILKEEHQNAYRLVRRQWVHKSLENRASQREFFILYKEMVVDVTKFYQYFHMSRSQLQELLEKIQDSITKCDTTFRKALRPIEKLTVYLR